MDGNPPELNSACLCCSIPPSIGVNVQYSSIVQSCSLDTCGFIPCQSGDNNTCEPNYNEWSSGEKCFPLRYLTKIVTRLDGSIETTTCTKQIGGGCGCSTTCSGSIVTTYNYNGGSGPWNCGSGPIPSHPPVGYYESCFGTVTTTKTYLSNCGHNIVYNGGGQKIKLSAIRPNRFINITSLFNPNGTCISDEYEIFYNTNTQDPCDLLSPVFSGTSPACFGGAGIASCPLIETIIDPAPRTTTLTQYDLPDSGSCNPSSFPNYPIFISCTPEGQTPPSIPPLLTGQGRNNSAYKYQNPYREQIKTEQKMRFRFEHGPTPSCYLKIWIRKKIQNWKWEDCSTGFSGDPPRTPPATFNCNTSPCVNRWSTNGNFVYENLTPYIWNGENYPCFNNVEKLFNTCENKIYSNPIEITASNNQSITMEFKFSYIENYEPNWPEGLNNDQGCKPNGYPLVNSECL